MLKRIIAALALTLMASTALAAGTWKDGLAAFERGDKVGAVGHWRVCAEEDDRFCQVALGGMYYNGDGVPQDYREAARLNRLSADQGHAHAQTNLGFMYDNGKGVPQNDAEAVRLYRLAADQGDAFAQYNLGVMYDNGQGITQDDVLAHMWFNLSAAQGDEDAAEWRDIVAKQMTPAQIAEAQDMAREWRPKQ